MSRTSLFLAILIMILFSCEEGYLTNCNECYASYDYGVILEIRYRNPDLVPLNPVITLYEGNISDSLIIEKYYINDPVYSYLRYYAIPYKDYSATMEFTYEGKKYITTASACPKVRFDETTCDEPCWYVYDNILELRLKYY